MTEILEKLKNQQQFIFKLLKVFMLLSPFAIFYVAVVIPLHSIEPNLVERLWHYVYLFPTMVIPSFVVLFFTVRYMDKQ